MGYPHTTESLVREQLFDKLDEFAELDTERPYSVGEGKTYATIALALDAYTASGVTTGVVFQLEAE